MKAAEGRQGLEYLDDLTGLYNRRYFRERLLAEKRRADRDQSSFALIMMDLDDFKPVNDLHGHLTGDRVLSQVARLLKESTRSTDVVCRYAGDEFVAILPETDEKDVVRIAERVKKALAEADWVDSRGEPLKPVTCSLGYAFYSEAGRDLDGLIEWADQALYAAKHRGGNGYCGEKDLAATRADRPLLVTPSMVGREKELKQLKSTLEDVRKKGGTLVTIAGEAGIGKTRLVKELSQFIERRRGTSLWGACHEETRAIPYYPFREALAGFFSEERKKSIALLKSLPLYSQREFARMVPNLREHKGLDFERAADPFRLFESIRLFLEKLAGESPNPLLVVVEDLHWADSASLDLLHYLARTLRSAPVLLCASYREEEMAREPALRSLLNSLAREELSEEILVEPLSLDAVALMLRLLCPGKKISKETKDSFHRRTDGNPFFVEELLKFLGSERPGESSGAELPSSITSLLERRIGSLEPEVREVLSCAALVGEEFEFAILCSVLGRQPEEVLRALDAACTARIVRESLETGDDKYRFVHSLMASALYAGLPKVRKKLWHDQTGEALVSFYEGRLAQLNGRLTYHFEKAEQWSKAVHSAIRSARQAKEDYANDEAVKLFERARRMLPKLEESGDELALEISEGLGEVYEIRGAYDKALKEYGSLEESARARGDRKRLAEAMLKKSHVHHLKGDYEKMAEYAKSSLEISRETGDLLGLAESLHAIGNSHWNRGEYAQALRHYEDAFARRSELGDMKGAGSSMHNIGNVRAEQGDHDKALECYQISFRMRKEARDRMGMASSLNSIGNVHANRGDLNEALLFYEEALNVRKEIGETRGVASSYNNIGTIFADKGQYEKALDYYEKALEIYREIGDRHNLAMALNNTGTIHSNRGEYAAALERYEKSLEIRREIGDRRGAAVALCNIAQVREARGDCAGALRDYKESLKMHRDLKDKHGIALCLHSMGMIHSARGEYTDALRLMEEALTLQREMDDRRRAASTLVSIGSVSAERGEYANALGYYRQALKIQKETGHKWGIAFTMQEVGTLYHDLHDAEGAVSAHKEALALMDELGLAAEKAALLAMIGMDNLLSGWQDEALESLTQSLELTHDLNAAATEPVTLTGLVRVWLSMGNSREAGQYCERLLAIAEERSLRKHVAVGKLLRSEARLLEAGAAPEPEILERVEADLKEARKIAAEMGSAPLLWQVHAALGRIHDMTGEPAKASREYGKASRIVEDLGSRIDDSKLKRAFLESNPVKSLSARSKR